MLYGTAEAGIGSPFLAGRDLDRKYPRASPLVTKAMLGPFLISDRLVSVPSLFHRFSMSLSSPVQLALSVSASFSLSLTVFNSPCESRADA